MWSVSGRYINVNCMSWDVDVRNISSSMEILSPGTWTHTLCGFSGSGCVDMLYTYPGHVNAHGMSVTCSELERMELHGM